MKKATIIPVITLAAAAAIFTAALFVASTPAPAAGSAQEPSQEAIDCRRAEISWSAFCAKRGYDLNDNSDQTTTEYLETWCGSDAEKAALINAGVEPY